MGVAISFSGASDGIRQVERYGEVQKIPTIYLRESHADGDSRFVRPDFTPGCEDVLSNPKWVARRKYDGHALLLDDEGQWWARKAVAVGRTAPEDFKEVYMEYVSRAQRPDNVKRYGWIPVKNSVYVPEFEDARAHSILSDARPGTYELCGPDINRNPERYEYHKLVEHSRAVRIDVPARCVHFPELRHFFRDVLGAAGVEGIVWTHEDGRMAKLKVRDFRGRD